MIFEEEVRDGGRGWRVLGDIPYKLFSQLFTVRSRKNVIGTIAATPP